MPKTRSSLRADQAATPEAQARELFNACELLAKNHETPKYDEYSDKVTMLVAQHIKDGQDEILSLAADMADKSETANTLAVLIRRIEVLVETVVIKQGPAGEPLQGFLFAIPVVLSGLGKLTDGKIKRNTYFKQMTQQLQNCGVLAPGQTLYLENYLYSSTELAMLTWSDVWGMGKALLRKGDRDASSEEAESELHQEGEDLAGRTAPAVLRFLVGIVANESSAPAPFEQPQDDAEAEAWVAKLQDWQDVAGPLLEKALGRNFKSESAVIAGVGGYFEAFRGGQVSFRELYVRLQIAQVETSASVSTQDLRTLVAAYVDERADTLQIVASISSKKNPELGGLLVCPVFDFECHHTALQAVADSLAGTGMVDISVYDQLLPVKHCEDCGEPLYLVPMEGQDQVGFGHVGASGSAGRMLH